MSAEIELLKQNNFNLANENANLKKEVKAIKSLRESLSKAFREIEDWKHKYQKIMNFIEHLDLTKKLQEFLKPYKRELRIH